MATEIAYTESDKIPDTRKEETTVGRILSVIDKTFEIIFCGIGFLMAVGVIAYVALAIIR